jgi:hypothetical protein
LPEVDRHRGVASFLIRPGDYQRDGPQERLSFDRITGREIGDRAACAIDSVAPLRVPIYNTLLGLERKMRLQHDPEKFKLDRDEREALMFVGPYYRSNRLP